MDRNDKMKNKTATECWNILRGELDSAINSSLVVIAISFMNLDIIPTQIFVCHSTLKLT